MTACHKDKDNQLIALTTEEAGELIYFFCDGCDTVLETEEEAFWHAWNKMKREGWRSYLDKDGWLHYCSKCMNKPTKSVAIRGKGVGSK